MKFLFFHKCCNTICWPQVSFLPLSKVVPKFIIKGFSSNKHLILRMNVLWGNSCCIFWPAFGCCTPQRLVEILLQALCFTLCLQAYKANGHALLAKSGEKRGGKGKSELLISTISYYPPKGPNEWRNIPFFPRWYVEVKNLASTELWLSLTKIMKHQTSKLNFLTGFNIFG